MQQKQLKKIKKGINKIYDIRISYIYNSFMCEIEKINIIQQNVKDREVAIIEVQYLTTSLVLEKNSILEMC